MAVSKRNRRGEKYCPVPPARKKPAPIKVPPAKPKRRPPRIRLMPDQYGIPT